MGISLFIVFLFIAVFVLLLIILVKSSTQEHTLEAIRSKINQLRDQLYTMEKDIKGLKKDLAAPQPLPEEKIIPPPAAKPEPVIPPAPVRPKEEKYTPVRETPAPVKETTPVPSVAIPKPIIEKKPVIPPPSKPKTDWEKFIGENLANKIGIAVLVLGISFFVKFAIDNDWINEAGRVIIGLLSGAILVGWAHYIRNSYRSFSSVLVGGGLTVFYFTIAFAFHQYHLIGQQAAFGIMVIITAFAVALSVFYDRMELAVLATIGGFVTPFLVSTGQNNYIALFTYLCILNTGLLVLSWFKRWKPINIIALFFTILIYGGWLIDQFLDLHQPFPYKWALFFATLFYLLSLAINIINNLKLKIKFGALDFILLLAINFLYYTAGITILQEWEGGAYKGLFTASLGVLNLLLAWIFYRQKQADRNFIYLLIGVTLTFISLTAPVQLNGNHITLFWAAEVVVLFWLYQRSRIVLIKISSLLLLLPLLVSLLMDWGELYSMPSAIIPVLANRGFMTTLVTSVAILLYYRLMRKEADTLYIAGIENNLVRNILLAAGLLLAFASGAWEIYYQFTTRLPRTGIAILYLQLYTFAFILPTLRLFRQSVSFVVFKFTLTIIAFIVYIACLGADYSISLGMLTSGKHRIHFAAHWISSALLIWLLYDLVRFFRSRATLKEYSAGFTWVAAICLIIVLSVEMYHIMMWTTYRNEAGRAYLENLYYRAGLSILWGICSFAMMWLGMKHKFKTLRIISLSLFTLTIVKLFLYDIRNVPPGGKIAAFILLGVLLLIVSFMYQRLKKIIMNDKPKE